MFKRLLTPLFVIFGCLSLCAGPLTDEGMWPITEIQKLGLRAKGLEIAPEDIYGPGGLGLIYGIVKVGATGSFVSPEGLILTNHHVAYGSAQAASTREKDYIRDGFLARTRAEEIEAKGMTARITDSFRDVSSEVLSAVGGDLSPEARTKAVQRKIKEIVAAAERANPGKRAEVSEMFPGKTYVLFVYTYLKDIRLVYVPPRSIGEFGGEEDNWMWPRHTGDFSFLRAYVGPDGSSADFSPENVPYRPKRFLQVAPAGVEENDFVFMLGYPGRTYRHSTSHFLAYEEEVRMPYVADWYAWQIALMEKMGEKDRGVAIKHLSRIKGLSNTMKNYRGKLKGMKRIELVGKKRAEERALQEFIDGDSGRRAKCGDLLEKIGRIYDGMRERSACSLTMTYLRNSVNLLNIGYTVYEASIERQKKDLERESVYMDRNFPQAVKRLQLTLNNYYEPTDRAIFKELLLRASRLPEKYQIAAFRNVVSAKNLEQSIDDYLDRLYRQSGLSREEYVMAALSKTTSELRALQDPFIELAEALYPDYQKIKREEDARKGLLDQLSADLIDVKSQFLAKDFVPDANGTLRLTYGRIKGYSPADAVVYTPFTTLAGVIEKTTMVEPFDTPPKIFDLFRAADFGRYKPAGLKSVPVCILYDTDTTGGNSGSPVFNARGELIGVNFDRTFEATINDYAWSEDYSRSIAVDIRYVLWVTEKFAGAEFLLKEMGIQ